MPPPHRLLAALLLTTSAAWADPALVELASGSDRVAFTAADVARTSGEQFGGEVQLTLTFQPDAAARIAMFTGRHVGQDIVLHICARELLRANLIEPITRGHLTVGPMTDAEATALASALAGRAGCPGG